MTAGTVFLVDPQLAFRAGLRNVLKRAGFDVIGEATTAEAAIAEIARLKPDLCVMAADPSGGVLGVRRIADRAPDTRMIVLAAKADADNVLAAVHAGAHGYLPRSTAARGLVRAAESVLKGEFAIPRAAISTLIHEIRGGGRRRLTVGGAGVSLTEREAQVLELLADGLETQVIARELGLSPITVRRHLSTIAAKLGQRGREQLLSLVRAA
jgi:two-component system, NarL family, nitrate/nitrite response regulator NarL